MAWSQRKNKSAPFVMIYREMLRSQAWEKIGNASRVAYLHLKAKVVSNNPGEITLSYKEMERYMERRTYAKAIQELEKWGFIDRVQRGGLFRRRNFFRLIEDWRKIHPSSGISDTVISGINDTVGKEKRD
jgi:hypothetical protein